MNVRQPVVVMDFDGVLAQRNPTVPMIQEDKATMRLVPIPAPLPGAREALDELGRIGVVRAVCTTRRITREFIDWFENHKIAVDVINGAAWPVLFAHSGLQGLEVANGEMMAGNEVERTLIPHWVQNTRWQSQAKPAADVYLSDSDLGTMVLGGEPGQLPRPWFSWKWAMLRLRQAFPEWWVKRAKG